jgi:hypothetical protein
MKRIKLQDLPELPPHAFQHDNSVAHLHIPSPLRLRLDRKDFTLAADHGFTPVGWIRVLPAPLHRPGCIGIMLFHRDGGEVWQHYPLDLAKCRPGRVYIEYELPVSEELGPWLE